MTDMELKALVEREKEWIIEMRRKLHRIPEKGFAEFKTQKAVMEALDGMGVPYTTERTWVIGLIEGALPGDTVGIRADMDALPVIEPEGCPFRSEHEGMMHACGHDAHTAMLLGAAKVLSGMKDQLRGFGFPLSFLQWPGIGTVLKAFFRLQGMIWLSLPLIVLPTRSGLRMPQWIGYALYPMHLILLILLRLANGITLEFLTRGF